MPGTKKLVIVESPAKAKTIAQYLGDGYEVQASVGHIRDLIEPKNLPPELKKGSLGKFSVDVENGFEPYYVVSDAKKKTVADLKRALKNADELYLATDEDREGEAIAWHLLEVLKPTVPVKRMVFHEITREAIQFARDNTRAHRHRVGRRAGDPPHPGPPVRLRGVPGAVAQGRPRLVRRPRAVRRDPSGRRPRTGTARLHRGGVLGPHRETDPAGRPVTLRSASGAPERQPRRHRTRLRRHRHAHLRRCRARAQSPPSPSPPRCGIRTSP